MAEFESAQRVPGLGYVSAGGHKAPTVLAEILCSFSVLVLILLFIGWWKMQAKYMRVNFSVGKIKARMCMFVEVYLKPHMHAGASLCAQSLCTEEISATCIRCPCLQLTYIYILTRTCCSLSSNARITRRDNAEAGERQVSGGVDRAARRLRVGPMG